MVLRYVTIDDEPLGVTLVTRLASAFPELKKMEGFTDGLAALEYLQQHPVDLLFIDIQMPDITGLQLVRRLDPRPMVIFTTAYREYAAESYELDAVDYLVKPVDPVRFEQAVKKAIDYFRYKNPGPDVPLIREIFVRSEYQLVRIDPTEVTYIESLEDYLRIHFDSRKPVMTLMTMKAMLDKLPPEKFKRVHRSYIVAMDKVLQYQHRKLQLPGIGLPVGESYMPSIQEWLKDRS
ncbi:MAG: response regulator transcription factor [Chitinophagaceae bacterium]|nr:MAG: response regulator transcription factor [Chitinophagaceae bacterium]